MGSATSSNSNVRIIDGPTQVQMGRTAIGQINNETTIDVRLGRNQYPYVAEGPGALSPIRGGGAGCERFVLTTRGTYTTARIKIEIYEQKGSGLTDYLYADKLMCHAWVTVRN